MRVFPFPIKMGRKWSFSFPILPGKGIPAEPCLFSLPVFKPYRETKCLDWEIKKKPRQPKA